jgi:hypothetical protein
MWSDRISQSTKKYELLTAHAANELENALHQISRKSLITAEPRYTKFRLIRTGCKKNSHKKNCYLFRRKLTEY